MAIKPSEPDTFLKEVDEELRKDQLNRFFARFGWWIIAAVVLAIGGVGGALWWQDRERAKAGGEGERLLEVIEAFDDPRTRAAAAPKIAELSQSDVAGYRAAGLFARAGAEAEAGNAAAAAATLRGIAADENFAEPYRQAALVRQTAIEFDRLRPQVVVQRLGALARPGQPWFGTAGEMVGIAHLKMQRPDLAGPLFARIARDETVPPSIRTRAIQMAGSLGINAMPETPGASGAPPQSPSDAAATREKAE